jgi:hypothetical protein
MREYRLTFATEDFGAISQILVDMGVSFRVEPIEAAAIKPSPPRIAEPASTKRSPARKAAKKKTGRADKAAKGGQASLAGAERLLESLARGGTGASPARLEPSGGAMQEPSGIAAEPQEPDERSV